MACAAVGPAVMRPTPHMPSAAAAAAPPLNASDCNPQAPLPSAPAMSSHQEASAAAPSLLAEADADRGSGDVTENPADDAHDPSSANDHAKAAASVPGIIQSTAGAARSHLAPLNGRPPGPSSGKSLGLGRRSVLGHKPGHLASNTPSRPGAAVSCAELDATAVKSAAGSKPPMTAPSSGGPRLQVPACGMLGAGTPTYRVAGLRRNSGPRLHASIGKAQ